MYVPYVYKNRTSAFKRPLPGQALRHRPRGPSERSIGAQPAYMVIYDIYIYVYVYAYMCIIASGMQDRLYI